jgi:hypothetical protein
MKPVKLEKKLFSGKEQIDPKLFSAQVWVVEKGFSTKKLTELFEKKLTTKISNFIKRNGFKFKTGSHITFDISSTQKFSFLVIPKRLSPFSALELARETLSSIASEPHSVLVQLSHIESAKEATLVDSFTSAAVALNYTPPKYQNPTSKKKQSSTVKPKLTV